MVYIRIAGRIPDSSFYIESHVVDQPDPDLGAKQCRYSVGNRRSSVVDPDPDLIRIQWGPWIRIRIQEDKMTHNIEIVSFFEVLDVVCCLLRAEGFSCSLDMSKLQFCKKDKRKFHLYFFLQFGH